MNKLGSKLAGISVLAAGNLGSAALSLARTIIIARLISVESFGIAATFLLATTLVDLVANIGVDRLMVQAADGHKRSFQAVAQGFQLFRGTVSAVVLFFLAGPIATLFGVPEAQWAYQVLALVPFLRGFAHLDNIRAQRHMRFSPVMMTETLPLLISTALAAPLAILLGDYRVALWTILLQVAFQVGISHAVAKRRYSLQWNSAIVRRLVEFGWPLLISGLLLFGTQQGDRFIIGATIGVEELGLFSAAFTVAVVPAMVVSKVCLSFFLPLLSKAKYDKLRFSTLSTTMIDVCLLLGVCYAVLLAVAGPSLFRLLFGERYETGTMLLGLLGAARGVSIARTAPATVSMADGDTKALLIVGFVRVAFLALALASVWSGFGLVGLAISGLIGEIVAHGLAIMLTRIRLSMAVRQHFMPSAAALLVMVATLYASYEFVTGRHPLVEIPMTIPSMIIAALFCLAAMPRLLREIRMLLARLRVAQDTAADTPVDGPNLTE